MQRNNNSGPLPAVPAESRCSFGVHQYQNEIFHGHHIPDESASHHNPERRDLFRDVYGLEPCVGFPQRQPICTPQLSEAISHQENPSPLVYEGKIATPLNSTFPDERSTCQVHKPQHVTSLTRKEPFNLISSNGQLVQQNYFPEQQNDSEYQNQFASSDHHEGLIYQVPYLQTEAVLIGVDEFVCSVCNLRLPSHANLQQHEEMHTRERSSSYNMYYRDITGNNKLLQHIASSTRGSSFSCTECGKKLSTKYTLRRHLLTHTGELPYKCDFCVYASATKKNLKRHQRTHTGERPFNCEICGSAFSQSTTLTNHLRTHTGERPFKCEYCGYSFARSYALTTHRRTHTGECPYKCKFCDYEAAKLCNLKTHITTQHQTHQSSTSETSTCSPTT